MWIFKSFISYKNYLKSSLFTCYLSIFANNRTRKSLKLLLHSRLHENAELFSFCNLKSSTTFIVFWQKNKLSHKKDYLRQLNCRALLIIFNPFYLKCLKATWYSWTEKGFQRDFVFHENLSLCIKFLFRSYMITLNILKVRRKSLFQYLKVMPNFYLDIKL